MNNKTTVMIEDACQTIIAKGMRIVRGPWLEFDNDNKIVACDPLVACLIVNDKMPALVPSNLEQMSNPGLIKAICLLLKVDVAWLFRFWMGFDRGHPLIIISDKEEFKCEVAAYGMQLAKELGL
jgi:hypothetical protein